MSGEASSDWTIGALKEFVESTLQEREKRWMAVEQDISRRLTSLEDLGRQILEEQRKVLSREEFEALEKRYEERHERLEIRTSLLEARVIPMLWIGAVIAVAVIGTFISHIVTGTP